MVLMLLQKKIQLPVKIRPRPRGGKIDRIGGGKGKGLKGALSLRGRVVFLKDAGQKPLRKLPKLGGVLGREEGAFRGRTRLAKTQNTASPGGGTKPGVVQKKLRGEKVQSQSGMGVSEDDICFLGDHIGGDAFAIPGFPGEGGEDLLPQRTNQGACHVLPLGFRGCHKPCNFEEFRIPGGGSHNGLSQKLLLLKDQEMYFTVLSGVFQKESRVVDLRKGKGLPVDLSVEFTNLGGIGLIQGANHCWCGSGHGEESPFSRIFL
jgi:hypothetical protein